MTEILEIPSPFELHQDEFKIAFAVEKIDNQTKLAHQTYAEKLTTFYNWYLQFNEWFKQPLLLTKESFLAYPLIQRAMFNYIQGGLWNKTKLTASSQVGYANALKKLAVNIDKDLKSEIETFIVSNKQEVQEIEEKNTLDGNEVHRWMPWNTILEIFENLNRLCEAITCFNVSAHRLFQQRLLLALYIYHPPIRLNYSSVYLDGKNHPGENRIVSEEDSDYTFFLEKDKVSSKIGSTSFKLDQRVIDLLLEIKTTFFKEKKRAYLLTMSNDPTKPLDTENSLHKPNTYRLLSSVPNLDGTDSKLTIDTLRSSFITHFLQDVNISLAQKKEMAKKMRTSTDMMERSYKKVLI